MRQLHGVEHVLFN